MHPYFSNYYPDEVILGKKNQYCNIKTFITMDKKIADRYKKKENINLILKSKYYYILSVN
jgi:hypothetical protein